MQPLTHEQSQQITSDSRNGFCYLMLLLYLFFVLVRVHEYLPLFKGVPVMPVLLGSATLVWIFNKRTFATPSQHTLMPVLLFVMYLTTAVNIGFSEAGEVVGKFLSVILLYYLIVDAIDRPSRFKGLFRLMIAAAVVMALHGVQQSIDGIGWTGMDTINGRIRYIGIFQDPNDMGLFFITVLPMLAYMIKSGKFFPRLIYLTALSIIAYGIYLTESRGTTLGVASLIGFYMLRRFGLIPAAIGGFVGLVLIMSLNARVADIDPGEASAKGRVDAWEEGYYMTRDHPILGVGVGGFVIHHYRTAHNTWVLAMAELGIPGYFIWNSLMILSMMMAIKIAKLKSDAPPTDDSTDKTLSDEPQQTQADTALHSDNSDISVTLLYSFVGLTFTAFFLSRSYNIFLYAVYAMIIAQYINMRKINPNIAPVSLGKYFIPIALFSVLSVIGFYFLAMLLYRLGG